MHGKGQSKASRPQAHNALAVRKDSREKLGHQAPVPQPLPPEGEGDCLDTFVGGHSERDHGGTVTSTCSIEGCGGPVKAKGWCKKHYMRWYRHGTTELKNPPKPPKPTVEKPKPKPVKVEEPKPVAKGPRPCRLYGCLRTATKHGLCGFHSEQERQRREVLKWWNQNKSRLSDNSIEARKQRPATVPTDTFGIERKEASTCSVQGCDRPAETRDGYCRRHRNQRIRIDEDESGYHIVATEAGMSHGTFMHASYGVMPGTTKRTKKEKPIAMHEMDDLQRHIRRHETRMKPFWKRMRAKAAGEEK